MSSYSDLTRAIVQQTQKAEDALPVQEGCRSQFFFHPAPTRRVCLFFHGFTGGPWQFRPLGETFFRAGYNVLIPLLPGHGCKGNWSRTNPTPLPISPKAYQDFALKWLESAQSLGQQVAIGGLSGGATLAGWLAFERPQQVGRSLLFAPFLSSKSKVAEVFVKVSDSYHEWGGKPDPKRPGYNGFVFPALRVFLDMGQDLLKRSPKATSSPMFILSTDKDDSVENADHENLFEALLPRQPRTWYYCFNERMNIPHTMMTVGEGNAWEGLLNAIAKAFVESDLTWKEVEEVSYRMTKGKTFNQVVSELKLTQRVSPDLPVLMTMLDKRSLVHGRYSGWKEK